MNKSQHSYVSKAAALFILASTPFSVLAIDSIQLGAQGDNHFSSPITLVAPIQPEMAAYLDLGDSLSGQKIFIRSTDSETYRVSVQLQTSLSIGDEGPHLDLTDWKHCTTDWMTATTINASTFQLPDFEIRDTECFPEVTPEEVRAEVDKQGGQRWLEVLDRWGYPGDNSPAYASLSTVRIKIEKKAAEIWQQVTVINVSVPMGC